MQMPASALAFQNEIFTAITQALVSGRNTEAFNIERVKVLSSIQFTNVNGSIHVYVVFEIAAASRVGTSTAEYLLYFLSQQVTNPGSFLRQSKYGPLVVTIQQLDANDNVIPIQAVSDRAFTNDATAAGISFNLMLLSALLAIVQLL
jgi:hypothetical protein